MDYTIHTEATAPETSRSILLDVKKKLGFIPNLFAIMAESPALLEGYLALSDVFSHSSLNATERQVVLMSANYVNNCAYCMAAHTIAAGMQKVPDDVVAALRNNAPIPDAKLEALRVFAVDMVTSRGNPSETSLNAALAAGYTSAQILDVILGISLKVLSNYASHLARTPLDPAFASAAWSKAV